MEDRTKRGSGKNIFPVGVIGTNKVSDARGRKPYGEERSDEFDSEASPWGHIKTKLSHYYVEVLFFIIILK